MGKNLTFIGDFTLEVLSYHLQNICLSYPKQLVRLLVHVYDDKDITLGNCAVTFSSSVFNINAPLDRLMRQLQDLNQWYQSDDFIDLTKLKYDIFINHKPIFNYEQKKQTKKSWK